MKSSKPFSRTARLNRELYKELSKLFLYEISDPLFSGITITAVKLSEDMKLAKIYYALSEFSNKKKVEKNISKLLPIVKSFIAKTVRMKRVPDFIFVFDEVFEGAFKIDKLIQDIKKDRNAK